MNSNTFAYTALDRAGFKPYGMTDALHRKADAMGSKVVPGWGFQLPRNVLAIDAPTLIRANESGVTFLCFVRTSSTLGVQSDSERVGSFTSYVRNSVLALSRLERARRNTICE